MYNSICVSKGECYFILTYRAKYYTKEIINVLKIILMAVVLITVIVFIKYKPQYVVKLNNKIYYLDSQNDLDKYIEEIVESKKGNIAFATLNVEPIIQFSLVNRNSENKEEELKNEIENDLYIEYTNYAISLGGKNVAYVANNEEAEIVVKDIKNNFNEEYINDLGIVQVYSENYDEIKEIAVEEAIKKVSEEAKNIKISTNKIKYATNKKNNIVNGVEISVKPTTGTITSRFGSRTSPGGIGSTNHKGIDIAAKLGTEIRTVANGTVEYAGYYGNYGKLVIINHGNNVKTYYAHCNSINVSKGDTVDVGDVIAKVGNTGASTGSHLHFEIRVNDSAINPQEYVY